MEIDKNEFFRQATLKICSNLDLAEALVTFIDYARTLLPIDRICVGLYDDGYGSTKCIALSTQTEGRTLNALAPISSELRSHLLKVQKSGEHTTVLVSSDDKNPLAREVLQWFDCAPRNVALMMLNSGHHIVAGVIFVPQKNKTFDQRHIELLALLRDPLNIAVSNAVKHIELTKLKDTFRDDNTYFQGELRKITGDSIVGAEFGLKSVITRVNQVAQLDSPVLLLGETGVGKDVIANAIHNYSNRADGPFISVNCGAIPESLIDSELFGYEKGAFTGALSQRRGRFERASGGTIFLDEIGELPLHAQVRLLRVLQDRTIERIGGSETIPLDIRFIAATNRDLERMVREKLFREDLWFRLNVFPIHIPPLRERTSDIPALVRHFVSFKSKEMKLRAVPSVLPGSMDGMIRYPWPGNVRELQNIVERALILNPGGPLDFSPLLQNLTYAKATTTPEQQFRQSLDEVMSQHIREVLSRTSGKVHGPGGAAEILGVNPSTLRHRMRSLGIPYGRSVRS